MKHASIYSAAAVLGKIVGFIMLPFYAHILREDGYAVIGLLDAGQALLVSMLAYGVQGANIQFYHDQTLPQKKKAVISTGIFLVLGASLALVIPLAVFARPISGLLLDNPDYARLFIMSLIAFVFHMGGEGASSLLLIQSRSVKFAAINLLRLVMGLGLNIWLILFLDLGLDGYFISALATSIVSNSILMFIAFRECGTSFDKDLARQVRDFLLPLIPGNLVSFASRQIERFLVKFQIDLSSVGILEMGYKFPVLIAMFVTTPFQQSWNTRRFEIANQPGADKRIGEMFTYYLFLVTFMGMVMAVVIKPVIAILTPPEFFDSYKIARVEILTVIMAGVYYHVAFGLFYAKHTKTLAQIRGWTAAVKVVMSWSLISTFGLAGAAWSAAIISAISVVVGFVLSQRRYRVDMEWTKITAIVSLAFGLFFLLNSWDATTSAVYRTIESRWLPFCTDQMAAGPLGSWKEGKIPIILAERSGPVTETLVKGVPALFFGIMVLFIHEGTRQKVLNRLRSRGGRP